MNLVHVNEGATPHHPWYGWVACLNAQLRDVGPAIYARLDDEADVGRQDVRQILHRRPDGSGACRHVQDGYGPA
jgi:hypothetical protein